MEYPDPEEQSSIPLQSCSICGRTFRPDALGRHTKVCEKNATRKRKVFDSSKQRALEEAQAKQRVKQKIPTPVNKEKGAKSNWREKHDELIRTIKQARNPEDKSVQKEKTVPSDYVQCPGCGRHFNKRAAERHVPWCKEKKALAPKPKARCRPPQGKSKPEEALRKSQLHSSPPVLLDQRNRIREDIQKRSVSRERANVKSQPELPIHIIKFKEKFPNHINKRNCDLEESLTSEVLRELLSSSRISDGPKTVPGVRFNGRSCSDVSRSSSSGSSSSWDKRQASSALPEVSSSEGVPWTAKPCWDQESSPDLGVFYCRQCGCKFPLRSAKYCCECGAKK